MMSDRLPDRAPGEPPASDTIAGTATGIPDEALAPGQEVPEMPDDAEVERVARKLGVQPRNGPSAGG